MHQTIVSAIASGACITLGYVKPNEVLTIRLFRPTSIERCKNGNTIVRGLCPHDGIPKSLSLSGIMFAIQGHRIGAIAEDIIEGNA